jgi:hypothetical protein
VLPVLVFCILAAATVDRKDPSGCGRTTVWPHRLHPWKTFQGRPWREGVLSARVGVDVESHLVRKGVEVESDPVRK